MAKQNQKNTHEEYEVLIKAQKREVKKRNRTKMKIDGASVKKLRKLSYS